MVNLLYYDFLSQFKRKYYQQLLSAEHVVGGQIKLDKLCFPDGNTDDTANFWGYVLEKDGVKYLLSSTDKDGREFNLSSMLPIFAKNTIKVASKGVVYNLIKKPVSAKIRPIKSMTYREMVDKFCSLEHSNTDHQKLMWFMTLAQMYDRANFRISTPAGFGKDSTIDVIGNLIGGASTIENPTLAKLEYMTHNKLLAINEVVDVKKADWRTMEQFLLASGAHKPEVTKHSRATYGGTKEVIDISRFSISLMYNDIDHYPTEGTYFDDVTKKAVKDRFPALRLYGNFTENFNSVKDFDVEGYVEDNYEDYKQLVANYEYHRLNYMESYHRYNIDRLKQLPERWKINIGRLLKFIDMYCDSEEEFNTWIDKVNKCLTDYEEMLKYPHLVEALHKKLQGSDFETIMKEVKTKETFIERNEILNRNIKGEKVYKDIAVHDIW